MFYNARYYSPLLSRFISADTLVPGAGNSQALNRYMYVMGNPLQYVDPSGHCPQDPNSSGAYICFALFIAPERIPVAGGIWTLHGDGRGFSSSSEQNESRLWIWLYVDEGKYTVGTSSTGYIRHEMVGGLPVGAEYIDWHNPSGQNDVNISTNEDGSYVLSHDVLLSGPLENTAPRLNGTITFSPDGAGGYTARGARDGFPWAEAYYHDGNGNVQTLLKRSAILGDPENLNAIEPEQPVNLWKIPYYGRKAFFVDLPLWFNLRSAPQQDIFGPPSCQSNRPC